MFDLKDPTHPEDRRLVLHLRVHARARLRRQSRCNWEGTTSVEQGAFGVDIRNRDGLIVLSDMRTGLWLFRMNGFNGWNGKDVGMPDISSVQDWDRGPVPH